MLSSLHITIPCFDLNLKIISQLKKIAIKDVGSKEINEKIKTSNHENTDKATIDNEYLK